VSQNSPIVIVGGTSLVAPYLMQRLCAMGRKADVIARRTVAVPDGFTVTNMDLTQARNWIAPQDADVISLLPLWILVRFLPRFIGVKSIVALGSTSRYSKSGSLDAKERIMAADLEKSENILQAWCIRSNVHGVLLRPTLIYDGVNDQNIARMARFIRRYRVLPLAAPAKGMRQPIHADDVACATINTLDNRAAYGKSLNIAGGEILTYRVMAERVFEALGMKPRFLLFPTDWLQRSFQWASNIGMMHETSFGATMFERMNQDLIFDVSEGLQLLHYEPRLFKPELQTA
jgi:nucleoside-diphosphate-sugar epimerase